MDMRNGSLYSDKELKEKKLEDIKEEIRDFAPDIPPPPKDGGPIVKLTPGEYAQLEKMPQDRRPAWLAYQRWIRSNRPGNMKAIEIFRAGYESAVKYHLTNGKKICTTP